MKIFLCPRSRFLGLALRKVLTVLSSDWEILPAPDLFRGEDEDNFSAKLWQEVSVFLRERSETVLSMTHPDRRPGGSASKAARAVIIQELDARSLAGMSKAEEASATYRMGNHSADAIMRGDPLCFRPGLGGLEDFRKALTSASAGQDEDSACPPRELEVFQEFAALSVPIIFCGSFDLQSELDQSELDPEPRPLRTVEADRLFLDSSIWHRFLPLHAPDSVPRLLELLVEIRTEYDHGSYFRLQALEHLDFAPRAFVHLRGLSPKGTGHAQHLSLHSFQSEGAAGRKAARLRDDLFEGELPFRFLLVDDQAGEDQNGRMRSMRSILASRHVPDGTRTQPRSEVVESKSSLLKRRLSSSGARPHHAPPDGKDWQIAFDVDQALIKLSRPRPTGGRDERDRRADATASESSENGDPFDIVLLDYLLGDSGSEGRERGTTLITRLEKLITGIEQRSAEDTETANEATRREPNLGPMEHMWIFPSSTFPTAFQGQVERGAISPMDRICHVWSGADPLCTPHLFKLKLYDMMRVMRAEALASPLRKLFDVLTQTAELGDLIQSRSVDGLDTKERALYHRFFTTCVQIDATLDSLRATRERGSRFCSHVLDQWPVEPLFLKQLTPTYSVLASSSRQDWTRLDEEVRRLRLFAPNRWLKREVHTSAGLPADKLPEDLLSRVLKTFELETAWRCRG